MKKILGIAFLLILQSCYFGAGLVEKEITDDYWLFANNTLDEMSIWFNAEKYSNRLIVPETVFALGENGDFIIAKSHPKNLESGIDKSVTYYYIIEVDKKSPEQSPNLTLEQFENKRKELNIPNDLDFDIVYEELQ
ncbi:DUF3997 domain-containing protein [Winogradskyella helgolandensis]|uniref:DUF3997 domain-containing protein n=1 Tax=Winogradskyella helgolandensis TaxID=2697010 RepID=UPI0015C93394|nr:DUF3997 domain-containing protein [Winogradskyella helgolandensis]